MAAKRDPRISDVFYYFEEFTTLSSGRTVGRKIGVVQEIICRKHLLSSQAVRDSLVYEPRIPGRSGATHKVEFVPYQPVEVLVVASGREVASAKVPRLSLSVDNIDRVAGRCRVAVQIGGIRFRRTVDVDRLVVDQRLDDLPFALKLVEIAPNGRGARLSLLQQDAPVASIESKRVGAQRFSSTDKLGSGIQTIEKAKQASLVAVDFDLKYNGTLLALSDRKRKRSFIGIVVLGNGVHWTEHDLSILDTYVDATFLVEDSAIIRYADFLKRASGLDGKEFFNHFMSYFEGMTEMKHDGFVVNAGDFRCVRPAGVRRLLDLVEGQLADYPVTA